MKRLIAASILTVFICVSLIFSISYVKSVCKEVHSLLKETEMAYEDDNNDNEAYKKASNLSKYWENQEKFLSVFVNHETLDEVESAIKSLKDYSDTENNEIFYEYSGTVEMLMHQLLEDTLPGVHSIF